MKSINAGDRKSGLLKFNIGIRELASRVWLASFVDYAPEFFDQDELKVEPMGISPFTPKP